MSRIISNLIQKISVEHICTLECDILNSLRKEENSGEHEGNLSFFRDSQRSEDGPPTLQPDGVAAAAEQSSEQMVIAPDNLEIPHLQRKLMNNVDDDEGDLQNSPPRLSPMCGSQVCVFILVVIVIASIVKNSIANGSVQNCSLCFSVVQS